MHNDEGSGEEHAHLYCDLHPALLWKVREDLSHSPSFLLTGVKRTRKGSYQCEQQNLRKLL